MTQPLYAVLLAGRIRPSAFGDALDIPIICLPIGPCGSLLDAWLRELRRLPNLRGVRVVVNTPEQVRSVGATITSSCLATLGDVSLDVIAEPAAWRGVAGIARDTTDHLPADADILVCEAKRLPPSHINALVQRSGSESNRSRCVVGVCGTDDPAGVYLFPQVAIQSAPPIGYFDLKEQFIPLLRDKGYSIEAAHVGEEVRRIQDLDGYLECVRFSLEQADDHTQHRIAEQAFIAPSAVLSGHCIIEAGAVIDERAVVHDSVVLWGATVSPGAVVNRCVVGSSAIIPSGARLAQSTVAAVERPSPNPIEGVLSRGFH